MSRPEARFALLALLPLLHACAGRSDDGSVPANGGEGAQIGSGGGPSATSGGTVGTGGTETSGGSSASGGAPPPSHPAVAEFAGDWYLAYHLSNGPGGGTYRRQVALDKLTFEGDGTVLPVTPTSGLSF